ncbi:beta-catenin-like protein 1 [Blastocystis sp. subtype 4]|uniref:beta-catenin-like protein 1 n=1 Tax=Blastocystis sp. subtype 4 TaxID=944170 RepID=UPI000711DAA7|nr:beta-catenin-like protein 1 [Blastocystis sp. subtype 4]KNB42336.1 beta-catenin-like protein 1 [Blastocystis sp. subtype 4]|eukprot:XP_014525779.1 beta-catenin-like protein 1 [Blastocystis sp. subtype 4]
MDDIFDNILNSKNRDNEKREREDILEDKERKRVPRLDLSGVKAELLELEKAINTNQRLRLKYSSDPSKFEESEYKLHEEIKRCSVFGTEPKCYPLLVKLDFVDTLLFLLCHDNILIVIETTKLLEELTDDSTIVKDVQGDAIQLIDVIRDKEVPKVLISNLNRLNRGSLIEEEGLEASVMSLTNVVEVHPESYWKNGLFEALLRHLEVESYDEVCLDCSELLFRLAGDSEGVDSLSENPVSLIESCYNLFNVLCMLLQSPKVRPIVHEKEVLDLLLIPIRKHKYARMAAFKAIDYLVSNGEDRESEEVIDKGGLKYLFRSLLGKNNGSGWKTQTDSDKLEFENHILSILNRLLQLPWGSIPVKRVLKKFHENDYEYCDVIVEIVMSLRSQKKHFDELEAKGEFIPNKEEEEEGISEEEKRLEKKLDLGVHSAIELLKKLMKDSCCKWHLERKLYEQGCDLKLSWIVCLIEIIIM